MPCAYVDEQVGRAIAEQLIIERVTDAVDRGAAGELQIFKACAEGKTYAGLHAINTIYTTTSTVKFSGMKATAHSLYEMDLNIEAWADGKSAFGRGFSCVISYN